MPQNIAEWNSSLMVKLSPSIVFLIVCFCVGVVGNSTVLIAYLRSAIPLNGRFFIPVLASVDLLAVSVSSLFWILYLCTVVVTHSDLWCQILNFGIRWMVFASVMIMLAISLDRYRKTCKIGEKQITLREKKMSILAIVIISALINSPMFATSGSVQISRKFQNSTIEGLTCDFSNNRFPVLEKIYCSILLVATIGTFIVSSVLNIRILYVITVKVKLPPKTTRNSQKRNSNNAAHLSHLKEPCNEDESTENVQNMENKTPQHGNLSHIENLTRENTVHDPFHFATIAERKNRLMESSTNGISMMKVVTMGDPTVGKQIHWETRRLKSAEKTRKTSLRTAIRKSRHSSHVMFFTIFLVFIVSHVAQGITMLYTRYEKYQWLLDDNDIRVNIYIVLLSSSLVSHALNPYIYGLFDKKLRRSLMKRPK